MGGIEIWYYCNDCKEEVPVVIPCNTHAPLCPQCSSEDIEELDDDNI